MAWLSGFFACEICKHEWVGIAELGAYIPSYECPNCGNMAGYIIEPPEDIEEWLENGQE